REEQARGFCNAVDRERATLSEIDVVQVQLENLIFRCATLEDNRHELLEQLAPHRAAAACLLGRELFGQEKVARQLLRDRAAAFEVSPAAEYVGDERSDHADRIDTGMLVVAPVLDRDDRLLHPL